MGQETIARLITYDGVKQSMWGLELPSRLEAGSPIVDADGKKVNPDMFLPFRVVPEMPKCKLQYTMQCTSSSGTLCFRPSYWYCILFEFNLVFCICLVDCVKFFETWLCLFCSLLIASACCVLCASDVSCASAECLGVHFDSLTDRQANKCRRRPQRGLIHQSGIHQEDGPSSGCW